jgi:hypothetical protein
MLKNLPIILLIVCSTAVAQPPKGEIREFTGTVKTFRSGMGLAYERLIMEIAGTEEHFVFDPKYAKLIFDNVRTGDQLTIRAIVYAELNERIKKMPDDFQKSFKRDVILAVKLKDQWVELPKIDYSHLYPGGKNFDIFLDREVKGEYIQDGHQIGLVFDNGIVAYNWFMRKKKINVGDIISFRGHRYTYDEGFVYPVSDVKAVYFFSPLIKEVGTIKSLLFKQNYVCIGMTVRTKKGEIRMGFPSNYAERIEQLAKEGKTMAFYYTAYIVTNQLTPPDLQAIVHEMDTFKINEFGFYGGADIKHDHKPASIKGKITHVNRSDKGRVLSIVIGNDCYVEIDQTMEKQLGDFFKKGQLMEISGDERIKAEGEIYSKNYRIITPRTVIIDGKNFLLGQQP